MSFYRKCKVKVTFDMYRRNGGVYLDKFEKEMEYEEDPKYKSKKEAYSVDGTLEKWCENVGKALALDVASKWVGAGIPEDLNVTILTGNTFEARNIKGESSECEEGSTCPEDVILRIDNLQETMNESEEKIKTYDIEVKELQEKRGRGETIDIGLLERYLEYTESEKGYIKSYQTEIDRLIRRYCEE